LVLGFPAENFVKDFTGFPPLAVGTDFSFSCLPLFANRSALWGLSVKLLSERLALFAPKRCFSARFAAASAAVLVGIMGFPFLSFKRGCAELFPLAAPLYRSAGIRQC
jgi:hypothetical protein